MRNHQVHRRQRSGSVAVQSFIIEKGTLTEIVYFKQQERSPDRDFDAAANIYGSYNVRSFAISPRDVL